ncbi:hypothetical protein SAMN06273572_108111 [Monaibacterium marinum]|uniref:Uncharacterized protein n=1 Tax=Pontivivens marinum TaxID=1690039 RepID=A0A2C9CVD7_9RHOB|nr:hypothetical protein [Monaibacterium marinum]SOH95237.1 hypothetical protein SAMN06273572_108111 [Monaibacterium marinum]
MTHRKFEDWDAYAQRVCAATNAGNLDWPQLPHAKRIMIDEGGKPFFTGKACKRGHVSPRNEHGDCTQCHLMRLAERRDAV